MNLYCVKIEEYYEACYEGDICTSHDRLVIANDEKEAIDFVNKYILRFDYSNTKWKSKVISAYKINFEKVNRKRITGFYIYNN